MIKQPTIKQLEALYWTGQLGSFQAAADHLCTSQSAISKRLAELENTFHVQLVDPTQRRARLNEQGRRLKGAAEEVLMASQRMMSAMQEDAAIKSVLRLGVSELVAVTWLPLLLDKITRQFPKSTVELDVAPGGTIIEKLKAGELHLAIVAGPWWDASLQSVEVKDVEYAWMASPRLAVPARVLSVKEMAQYPMLVHARHGIVSQLLAQWQRKVGMPLKRVFTANSLMVMVQMTIGGLGISCLPKAYVANHVAEGRLMQVRTKPRLPRAKYFAVYRNVTDSPFVAKILPLVATVCDFTHNSTVANSTTTLQDLR